MNRSEPVIQIGRQATHHQSWWIFSELSLSPGENPAQESFVDTETWISHESNWQESLPQNSLTFGETSTKRFQNYKAKGESRSSFIHSLIKNRSGFWELGTLLADQDGKIRICALKPSWSGGLVDPVIPSPQSQAVLREEPRDSQAAFRPFTAVPEREGVLEGQGKLLREIVADPHGSARREIRREVGMVVPVARCVQKKWSKFLGGPPKPLSPSPRLSKNRVWKDLPCLPVLLPVDDCWRSTLVDVGKADAVCLSVT